MDKFEIDGLIFEDLGGICPRQFEVYDKNNKYLAYIRYRYGNITVSTEPLGDCICSYSPKCKYPMQGDFNSEKQALQYLKRSAKKINNYYYLLKHPKRKYTKKRVFDLTDSVFSKILFENLFNDIKESDGYGIVCKYNKSLRADLRGKTLKDDTK